MSEHKVQGGTMLLYIAPANDENYDTVVCLTSIGKDDTVGEVDSSSACGPDINPGVLALSRPFEGFHLQDPDTGKISGTSLRTLMYNKTKVGYKISPVTPVEGDEIEVGEGHIFALSSTYAFDSDGTFTGTLRPSGVPVITEQS